MPGLGTTFGRGGATTAQQDLSNADAILIMGSSMAENHPVGFQWVMEARERGGKVIHVDPRFTRTSAMADVWLPLRAGSDIIFLGGMIHYILENNRYFHDYVVNYTNAANLVRDDFRDTEDLDGFFSGWDAEKKNTIRSRGSIAGRRPSNVKATYRDTQTPMPATATKKVAKRRRPRVRRPIPRCKIRVAFSRC